MVLFFSYSCLSYRKCAVSLVVVIADNKYGSKDEYLHKYCRNEIAHLFLNCRCHNHPLSQHVLTCLVVVE
jgi:hypothetical protein